MPLDHLHYPEPQEPHITLYFRDGGYERLDLNTRPLQEILDEFSCKEVVARVVFEDGALSEPLPAGWGED